MIIITGPGRSGTTFLAMLYRELGFDPGGRWNPRFNAGMESKEFQRLNNHLAEALGTFGEPRRGPTSLRNLEHLTHHLPAPVQARVKPTLEALRYRRITGDFLDWTRLSAVVDQYGESMRDLSARTDVVKDPRFCQTLHAWLASGASIEAVVLTIRPLGAMVDSRVRAGMIPERARGWAANNFTYATGLAMTAIVEHRVPFEVLRFPDFLNDPDELHRRLPFPEERSNSEFRKAFTRLYDSTLVHDMR